MTPDITNLQKAKRRLDDLIDEQNCVVAKLTELREQQTANANLIYHAKIAYEAERDSVVKVLLK